MIKVKTIWDAVRFRINPEENGQLAVSGFNVLSRDAELRLIDWLTGNSQESFPYPLQKNRDLLKPFSVKKPLRTEGGQVMYPEDYYTYDNLYVLGPPVASDCETDVAEFSEGCNTTIEVIQGQKFNNRCNTRISGLRPTNNKPIAKQVGGAFETMPKDLGSVMLEYIRYPKFAELKTRIDEQYNDEVVSEESVDYEWDAAVEPALVWLIVRGFAPHTREKALQEHNELIGNEIK